MTTFLETLSALLVVARMLGMTDISLGKAIIPLIVSAVIQLIAASLEVRRKDAENIESED